ncbi:MAG: GDP-mannose 4,6-dehydratase [Candidatus Bipolaricaulaceae bacterium]
MSKTAFITGITGQDGSYLAELLLEKGYQVYGLVRRTSSPNYDRIKHVLDRVILLEGDLTDFTSLQVALDTAQPDEIYNLAAQSFVGTSWKQPILTGDVTGLGAVRLFEAARWVCPKAKIYQASSSEMFGHAIEVPQRETTPFNPQSPYACAKVFAHHMAINYRKSYGMFIACGICFNHESPRRGFEFVSRKITDGVARIKLGLSKELRLGNLDARRDWGFAGDYVKAMWLMLQQDHPDDFVIATGESHSVREFVELAFSYVDLDWRDYVVVDERFYRPVDVPLLQGDYTKAKQVLGWEPRTSFEELVKMMVDHDLERLRKTIEQ